MNPSPVLVANQFFLLMSVVIAAVVTYGFGFTIADNLIHPAYPRPWVLYVHAVVMAAWIALFILQAGLVRLRRLDLHRWIGQAGLMFGAVIPVLGIATAIAMAKVHLAHGDADAAVSFPIPVNDATGFAVAFGLAALWRRRPEYHRRLMFVATCILTAAAFGRMPMLDHAEWFYAGVDVLILIGAARDLAVSRKIHVVYWYALPAVVCGQLLTAYVRWTPAWLKLAPVLFR
jgi:hypothetical protein